MKGQKLYVRFVTPDDNEAISAFYRREGFSFGTSDDEFALAGKVVGQLAAHLSCHRNASDIVIDSLLVASELRRKRIGRTMLDHLVVHAREIGATRLVIRNNVFPRPFATAVGFAEEGDRYLLTL
jgi:ribosomal protein S18 acetylase RimI-like enzyme